MSNDPLKTSNLNADQSLIETDPPQKKKSKFKQILQKA